IAESLAIPGGFGFAPDDNTRTCSGPIAAERAATTTKGDCHAHDPERVELRRRPRRGSLVLRAHALGPALPRRGDPVRAMAESDGEQALCRLDPADAVRRPAVAAKPPPERGAARGRHRRESDAMTAEAAAQSLGDEGFEEKRLQRSDAG